jgi:hypothetical protein
MRRKEKANKKKRQRVSPSAEGDKGYSPLTAPPFEERKQTRKRDLREFASQTVADENFSKKIRGNFRGSLRYYLLKSSSIILRVFSASM